MSIILPPIPPRYGFTLQEMLNVISAELGNVNINSLITTWINMVVTDLASKLVFSHLHKYDTKVTAAGIPDLALAEDFFWLKTVAIPSQSRKLYPEDEQRISEGFPQYRSTQGTVSYYYLSGTNMGLWQVPSGAFNVEYSYQRRPTKLSNLDDVCDLPPEWHTLVMQKAITKGYSQEGNESGFATSMQLEARLARELHLAAYRRPDETLVLSGPSSTGRPPRPKLPSNYPAVGR